MISYVFIEKIESIHIIIARICFFNNCLYVYQIRRLIIKCRCYPILMNKRQPSNDLLVTKEQRAVVVIFSLLVIMSLNDHFQDQIFNETLPIEYLAWEKAIVNHSSMINVPMSDDTGWIPTRQCRTLTAYRRDILGKIIINTLKLRIVVYFKIIMLTSSNIHVSVDQ
jgi:hypothetical protein